MSAVRRNVPGKRAVLGIDVKETQQGLRVIEVATQSAAAKAGLQAGDLVIHVSRRPVENREFLARILRTYQPGDFLTLRLIRDDATVEVRASLGRADTAKTDRGTFQNNLGGRLSRRRDGFKLVLLHDTVLRPEDCGGPVVDLHGRAVGINIARAGRAETYTLPVREILPFLAKPKSKR